jgi:hypothetical protein
MGLDLVLIQPQVLNVHQYLPLMKPLDCHTSPANGAILFVANGNDYPHVPAVPVPVRFRVPSAITNGALGDDGSAGMAAKGMRTVSFR